MEQYPETAWLGAEAISDDELRRKAAHALGIPFVVLEREHISLEALVLIPEPFARMHNLVIYAADGDSVEVALLDMEELKALEALRAREAAGWKIKPRLTNRESIKRALLIYQKHLKANFAGIAAQGIEAADSLLKHALLSRATYIHLEPSAAAMLVRYRVGGALHDGTGIVPLSEATEAYEVDILTGSRGRILRTLKSTVPTVTYEMRDIIDDFGVTPEILNVVVYQMSAIVGRGFGRASAVEVL